MEINKKRVGIYLRLSSEDKDKVNKYDESESIKNQRFMLMDYIRKHSDLEFVKEYCDEDLSGAGTYRPAFERLINDCEIGRLDIVLAKSQSRFSRDMEIVEKYINNKFMEWNVRFIGLSDNADTNNYGNKKARQINGLVNEWYLEDISNNIRTAFYSKMCKGEYISPFTVYGYKIDCSDNNKIVIDQEVSKYVKEIYNLYLQGYGYNMIAKYLNDKKVLSPSLYKYYKGIKLNIISNKERKDIKWNSNAIKNILSNEIYIGNLIQGKRTTISYKNHKIIRKDKKEWIRKNNTHDAIINKKLFYKVQKEMNERTKVIKKTGKVHNFAGKVYCMECKNLMRKKNSGKWNYLSCSNCNNKSIRYDILEKIILNTINKKIEKYYDKKIINRHFNDKELEYNRKRINDKNNKINNYIKEIYLDKVRGIINEDIYIELRDSYLKEIEFNNNKLLEIDTKIKKIRNNNVLKFKELDRVIVEEFIDRIWIGKEKYNDTRNIIVYLDN